MKIDEAALHLLIEHISFDEMPSTVRQTAFRRVRKLTEDARNRGRIEGCALFLALSLFLDAIIRAFCLSVGWDSGWWGVGLLLIAGCVLLPFSGALIRTQTIKMYGDDTEWDEQKSETQNVDAGV